MAKVYNTLPSKIMNIEDEYTAFCFDEACDEIIYHLSQNEKPVFKTEYRSFSDFYKQFD